MPDLLAGTVINALDTPPTVSNSQSGSFSFNGATYGIDADAGTYVDCGVAFTACTTGRMLLHYEGALDNDTAAAFTLMAPVIRAGSTVGAGASVVAGADANAIFTTGTNEMMFGRSLVVPGLTPGTVYNVRLEHGVSAGIGNIRLRSVVVAPAS